MIEVRIKKEKKKNPTLANCWSVEIMIWNHIAKTNFAIKDRQLLTHNHKCVTILMQLHKLNYTYDNTDLSLHIYSINANTELQLQIYNPMNMLQPICRCIYIYSIHAYPTTDMHLHIFNFNYRYTTTHMQQPILNYIHSTTDTQVQISNYRYSNISV